MRKLGIIVLALMAFLPAVSLVSSAPTGAVLAQDCFDCKGYRGIDGCPWYYCSINDGWTKICFEDNEVDLFGCGNNGCWVSLLTPCFNLSLRLDGSFDAPNEEDAGGDYAEEFALGHNVIGSVRRACGDVIVERLYDAVAERQVRTATAHIAI